MRIRSWGSRNISFVGRSQHVNSVLMSIYNYCTQIFIIHKILIRRINAICRSFLRSENVGSTRPGNVDWETICQTKKLGGLGIQNATIWYQAALGKLIWDIARKKDNLGVKWVHFMYVKSDSWWQYHPPCSNSWSWKFICRVKI